MYILILTALLFGSTSHADAIPPGKMVDHIQAKRKACMDNAESNADMKQCEADAYVAADKELNSVYKKMIKELNDVSAQEQKDKIEDSERYGAETKRRLVESQRAWVKFRDTNCSYKGTQMLNGSGEGLIVLGCLADTTLNRVAELNEQQ
jgi:uncharacterized protein YecT (DUF1311 family)